MSEPVNTRRHEQSYLESEIKRLDQLMTLHWKEHDGVHAQSIVELQHRFDAVNELRGQLGDVINTMAPKTEIKNILEMHYRLESDMLKRFEIMTQYVQKEAQPGRDLKTSQMAIAAAIIFAVSILGGIFLVVNFFLEHR